MSTDLKSQILSHAARLFARGGLDACTRNAVAAAVGCSTGSVSFHFKGEIKYLHRAVIAEAIATRNLSILGWAVAARHPSVRNLDPDTRAAALRHHCQMS